MEWIVAIEVCVYMTEINEHCIGLFMIKSKKSTAAKMTAEINTVLKHSVRFKTVQSQHHKSCVCGRAEILKPLVNANSAAKRRQ